MSAEESLSGRRCLRLLIKQAETSISRISHGLTSQLLVEGNQHENNINLIKNIHSSYMMQNSKITISILQASEMWQRKNVKVCLIEYFGVIVSCKDTRVFWNYYGNITHTKILSEVSHISFKPLEIIFKA